MHPSLGVFCILTISMHYIFWRYGFIMISLCVQWQVGWGSSGLWVQTTGQEVLLQDDLAVVSATFQRVLYFEYIVLLAKRLVKWGLKNNPVCEWKWSHNRTWCHVTTHTMLDCWMSFNTGSRIGRSYACWKCLLNWFPHRSVGREMQRIWCFSLKSSLWNTC